MINHYWLDPIVGDSSGAQCLHEAQRSYYLSNLTHSSNQNVCNGQVLSQWSCYYQHVTPAGWQKTTFLKLSDSTMQTCNYYHDHAFHDVRNYVMWSEKTRQRCKLYNFEFLVSCENLNYPLSILLGSPLILLSNITDVQRS